MPQLQFPWMTEHPIVSCLRRKVLKLEDNIRTELPKMAVPLEDLTKEELLVVVQELQLEINENWRVH